jgi:hypothetical protein
MTFLRLRRSRRCWHGNDFVRCVRRRAKSIKIVEAIVERLTTIAGSGVALKLSEI